MDGLQYRAALPSTNVLGFSGSPRKNGNSDIILKNILDGLGGGVASKATNLSTVQFSGCVGCEKCRRDKVCTGLVDGMSTFYDSIVESQGLVLVCPTHNYNITAWMKAFIDRLYCFYNFAKDHPRSWSSQLAGQNRKAVIAAICEQENATDMGFTLEAMKQPLIALGYEIVGELTVFKIFDKGGVKKDKESIAEARALGAQLATQLKA